MSSSRIDGKPVENAKEFSYRVATAQIGVVEPSSNISASGKRTETRVELIAAPETTARDETADQGQHAVYRSRRRQSLAGGRRRARPAVDSTGVVAADIKGGPARRFFRKGDIILEVNGVVDRLGRDAERGASRRATAIGSSPSTAAGASCACSSAADGQSLPGGGSGEGCAAAARRSLAAAAALRRRRPGSHRRAGRRSDPAAAPPGGFLRSSCGARPAPARRRSRGCLPARPACLSSRCRRSFPASPISRKPSSGARAGASRAGARCSSSMRSIASTARSRTASCPLSKTARSRWSAPPPKIPSFELNGALLSRAQVLVLNRLDPAALEHPDRARRGALRSGRCRSMRKRARR